MKHTGRSTPTLTEWCITLTMLFSPDALCEHMNNKLNRFFFFFKADWFYLHKAQKTSPSHPHQLCCFVSKLFSMAAGASSRAYFSTESRCYSYCGGGGGNLLSPVSACTLLSHSKCKRQPDRKQSFSLGRSEARQSKKSGSRDSVYL